jgi:hypothetical protein
MADARRASPSKGFEHAEFSNVDFPDEEHLRFDSHGIHLHSLCSSGIQPQNFGWDCEPFVWLRSGGRLYNIAFAYR